MREAVLRERREAFIWLFKAGDVVFVVALYYKGLLVFFWGTFLARQGGPF